jgi:hypothetical protein
MLHVLNGDATREKLERAGLPGEFTVWADPLHEGPVPDVREPELRAIRAVHLAEGYDETPENALRELERWYRALERYPEHEEVVFWYEHDLFDQLILIRHLDWLSRLDAGATRFTMVPADDYLGPQAPERLAALFTRRRDVTAQQIETGTRAWALFRAADPTPLVDWVNGGGAAALEFLPAALRRHLEEFPSTRDGLSRTERQLLEAVAGGHHRFTDAFVASQHMEDAFFLGDSGFWLIARRLAHAAQPVLTITSDAVAVVHDARLALTSVGDDVLAGRADHIRLNGIDRWLGGAHLTTARSWRWDGARLRVWS